MLISDIIVIRVSWVVPSENFKEFADSIEVLRLINKSQKYVVDLFSYKSP